MNSHFLNLLRVTKFFTFLSVLLVIYELVLIIVFMIVMMFVGSEIQQRVDRNIAIEHNVACWSINATNGESQFTWKVMSGN